MDYGREDVTEFRNEGANGVRSIAEDKNGDLWLGTHENGAYKFNGTTFVKCKQ